MHYLLFIFNFKKLRSNLSYVIQSIFNSIPANNYVFTRLLQLYLTLLIY